MEGSQTNPLNERIVSFQPMSKPYELTLTQSQSGNKVSTDQLIEQFESILSKSQLLNEGGNQKLLIKELAPGTFRHASCGTDSNRVGTHGQIHDDDGKCQGNSGIANAKLKTSL